MKNIGYFYYKEYFREFSDEDLIHLSHRGSRNLDEKMKHITNTLLLQKVSNKPQKIEYLDYTYKQVTLKTLPPGLLIGIGYAHEVVNLKGQFINGFYFDYTTGLPEIPGSGIKGVIRNAFPLSNEELKNKKDKFIYEAQNETKLELINQFLNKNYSLDDVIDIRDEILDYNDIFLEAIINANNQTIFEEENFTPHKSELKNPIPLKFLKIKGGVKFTFRFLLKDGKISVDEKLELIIKIITTYGIGAKTNENYGRFEVVFQQKPKQNGDLFEIYSKPNESFFKKLKTLNLDENQKKEYLSKFKQKYSLDGKWAKKIIKLLGD